MDEISATDLRDRLLRHEPLAVVDIRSPAEFDAWHIAGAVNVPVYDALRAGSLEAARGELARIPRDRTLVTVCRAGVVARRAVQVLRGLRAEAVSLTGGMRAWGGVWTEAPVPMPGVPGAALIQVRRNGKGCLSYVLAHGGRAAVVDPSVEISAYLEILAREGWTLDLVLETHVHADHLSRAAELSRRAGAALVYPENGRLRLDHRAVRDGEVLRLGGLEVTVVATPGHTSESVCYRVDGDVVLTGDTLFAGAVGRPDLEAGDEGAEAGARALWRSLRRLQAELPPGTRVLPAHHAGPVGFDGEPVGTTLSEAAADLPLLHADETAFVTAVLAGLGAKPPNYAVVLAVNEGRQPLEGIDPLDLEAGPNRCAVR